MSSIDKPVLHEILRKLTPCFEERVNAIKAFMETPTHSIQQEILVEDAVAEMKAILFDANIVEAVVRRAMATSYVVIDNQAMHISVGYRGHEEGIRWFDTFIATWPELPALVAEAWA